MRLSPCFRKCPRHYGGDVKFAAGLLWIDVIAGVLLGKRRRTNIERARVSQSVGDFVGQRGAQELDADVAVDVAQRQNRDGVLQRATAALS